MASQPPSPPREPEFLPPRKGSTLGTVLRVLLWIVGGFVVLAVVGTGLLFATCAGM